MPDAQPRLARLQPAPAGPDPRRWLMLPVVLTAMFMAGFVTKRIQGARGYMSLRKDDLDERFPGLIDSILAADAEPVA